MTRSRTPPTVTWRTAVRTGAGVGIALTFAYALIFAVLAIVAASATILQAQPADPLATLAANGLTLLYLALMMALLLSILTALIGAGTGVIVYTLDRVFNARHTPLRAAAIGTFTTTGIWLIFYLLIRAAGLGQRLGWAYPATFLFWLILPGLIYICTAGVVGVRLNALAAPAIPQ
jgi:hypothetical protein